MTLRQWLLANPPKEISTTVQGAATTALGCYGPCPAHANYPLIRSMNRPEDLYVCQVGPHYMLWTPRDPAGAVTGGMWRRMENLNDLPELDKPLGHVTPKPEGVA